VSIRVRIGNATVVDVVEQRLLPAHDVFVDGGRIDSVVSAGTKSAPSAETIDASGLFLCPGLIDSHVHFFLDAGGDPRGSFLETTEEERWNCAARNARMAIEAGITTMRDCAAPADQMFALHRHIDAGRLPGPHILSCGYAIMRPAGHCHFLGGIEVSDSVQVESIIEQQLSLGSGFVKLMASGGGLTPGTVPHDADLDLVIMRKAAAVARANGVHITAHCHATESILRAVEAGLPQIEHATFVEPPGRYRYDDDVARRVRDIGAAIAPTVFGALKTAQRFRVSGSHNPNDTAAVERLEGRLTNTTHFHELGIPMMAGTDCGATDTPFDALVDELHTYVRAGIPEPEVVAMATCGNARLLGLTETGAIAPGLRADMVLLAGDPFKDLDVLRAPLKVLKSGSVVCDRESTNP